VKFSNNIKYKRNYFIKLLLFCHVTSTGKKKMVESMDNTSDRSSNRKS